MVGGAHYFHCYHCSDPTRMACPFVGGFEIVRVWDEDREAADAGANVFTKPAKVCDSFAEVCDDVNLVFVADCNGDGSNHFELAEPGLRKGWQPSWISHWQTPARRPSAWGNLLRAARPPIFGVDFAV